MARNGWLIIPSSLYETNKDDFGEIGEYEVTDKTKNTVELVYADYNNEDFRRKFLPLFDKFPDAPFNLSQDEAEGGYDFSSGVDTYIRPGKEQVDVYWNDNFLENIAIDELKKCSSFEEMQDMIKKYEESRPTDIVAEAEIYNMNHPVHKYHPETKGELKALVDDESIKLGDIDVSKITDMSELFRESNRDDFSGIEKWDVSNVTDMSYLFMESSFNENISNWNVSKVTDMSAMFMLSEFNQPIDEWDVSNVVDMSFMFEGTPFNQSIENWDVSKVEDMMAMFRHSSFNQPIDKWDVSNVENMKDMFYDSTFNQPLNSWDVSKVEDMTGMFDTTPFNQPLDNWKISSFACLAHMFRDSDFNQSVEKWGIEDVTTLGLKSLNNDKKKYSPETKEELKALVKDESINLGDIDVSKITDMSKLFLDSKRVDFSGIETWDVSNVKDMSFIFDESFINQPLDKWDVSNVTNMSYMFANTDFNHPIENWDVSKVNNMESMFYNSSFNQSVNDWQVANVSNMAHMFECSAFNQPLDNWQVSPNTSKTNMFRWSSFEQIESVQKWGEKDLSKLGIKQAVPSFEDALTNLIKSHIEAGESLPDIGKQLKSASDKAMLELGKAHVAGKSGR